MGGKNVFLMERLPLIIGFMLAVGFGILIPLQSSDWAKAYTVYPIETVFLLIPFGIFAILSVVLFIRTYKRGKNG